MKRVHTKTGRFFFAGWLMLLLASYASGCAASSGNSSVDTNSITAGQETATGVITLNGDSIDSGGSSVDISGTTVTITSAGTYTFSGTLNDGQIIVDSSENGVVNLMLSGTDIACSTSAPIYIKNAEKTVITLAEGTNNTVTDAETYIYENAIVTEPDAAIFSTDDLVIEGSGSLTVNANYNDGIACNDSLEITGGTISVTAVNHGIKGKDYLDIKDGVITVSALGDGMKSTNDTDPEMGYVLVEGGTINISAGDEGMQAVNGIQINGGTIDITAENNGLKTDVWIDIQGGVVTIEVNGSGLETVSATGSETAEITVNGSSVTLQEAQESE